MRLIDGISTSKCAHMSHRYEIEVSWPLKRRYNGLLFGGRHDGYLAITERTRNRETDGVTSVRQ